MAITVDWPNGIINVPKSYLTLISGTLYELDTNQLRKDLRALEDDDQGMAWPKTHIHQTSFTLSGVPYARVFQIVNGYTVTFEDGLYAVNLANSNNNILDVTNRNQVGVAANNSAGLQNQSALETGTYNNLIMLDVAMGEAGQQYPIGTMPRPVNNLVDALAIATATGIHNIHVHGALTLDALDWSYYRFIGINPLASSITVTAGATTVGTEFHDLTITGVLSTSAVVSNSKVLSLTLGGIISECSLTNGVTMTGDLSLLGCYSAVAGLSHPEIDAAGGTVGSLGIRKYHGGIGINNSSSSGFNASIDVGSARVHLHDTLTAGLILLSGVGVLTDESAGATVVSGEGFLESRMLKRMHTAAGLEQGNPATITPTSHKSQDNAVDLTLTGDGVATTTITSNN